MTEKIRTAEEMALDQKEISISEFFEKNRHLLGYDNKIKALLIIVKEAVDNSLDACEDARILPDIYVKIEELEKEKYKLIIKDNGPGIVKEQIPKIFGTLLYGSKFHKLSQSRGQQGIGVSAAALYSQLTSGEAVEVLSSTKKGKNIHKYKIRIDVKKNTPEILSDEVIDGNDWQGIQITFVCEGMYREHKQSVLEYLKQTAISNPFANITFDAPTGKYEFKRGVEKLPVKPKDIKPHLYGVEVGILTRMIRATKARSVSSFLTSEFSRIGKGSSEEICKKAEVDPKISPRRLKDKQILDIIKAVKEVKLSRPPTDCLSPIGEDAMTNGLKKELDPEFTAVVSRSPTVYRGWPFQIEVGIAYGGSINEPKVMRFANKVPLLYQAGDCAITKSISEIEWKRYGIDADRTPTGHVILFVHMCSVWVPFTSESKEAIANYPIIIKEIKLALQECARKLSIHLSRMRKEEYQAERLATLDRYANETAVALSELTDLKKEDIFNKLKAMIQKQSPIVEEEKDEGNSAEGQAKKTGK